MSSDKTLPSLVYDAKTDNFVSNVGESLVNSILAGQYGKSNKNKQKPDANSAFFRFEQNDGPPLDMPLAKFDVDEVFESFGVGNDQKVCMLALVYRLIG